MTTLQIAYLTAQERLTALESIASFSRGAFVANSYSYFAAQRELERVVQLAAGNRRYARLEAMFAGDEKLEALMELEFEDDGSDHPLSDLLLESAWRVIEDCREALHETRAQYNELEKKTSDVRREVAELQVACLNWARMREKDAKWEGR